MIDHNDRVLDARAVENLCAQVLVVGHAGRIVAIAGDPLMLRRRRLQQFDRGISAGRLQWRKVNKEFADQRREEEVEMRLNEPRKDATTPRDQ